MIAHLPAVNVCNISTFPVCLHLQTTAIFSIFHLVIAPRERRCSRRFIFRTHSPPTLASMESRACVTRKNVLVEPDADWLETRNVPPPCSPLMGNGPAFCRCSQNKTRVCGASCVGLNQCVCVNVFEWVCVLTAAGRGDIHQFHSFGINKKLKDLDIYMNQVSESGLWDCACIYICLFKGGTLMLIWAFIHWTYNYFHNYLST